jgi:hypothetical protein
MRAVALTNQGLVNSSVLMCSVLDQLSTSGITSRDYVLEIVVDPSAIGRRARQSHDVAPVYLQLEELYKMLEKRYLPLSKRWHDLLVRLGPTRRTKRQKLQTDQQTLDYEPAMRSVIELRNRMMVTAKRCADIKGTQQVNTTSTTTTTTTASNTSNQQPQASTSSSWCSPQTTRATMAINAQSWWPFAKPTTINNSAAALSPTTEQPTAEDESAWLQEVDDILQELNQAYPQVSDDVDEWESSDAPPTDYSKLFAEDSDNTGDLDSDASTTTGLTTPSSTPAAACTMSTVPPQEPCIGTKRSRQ